MSPTIPNPAGIFRSIVLRTGEPWGITLPCTQGRVFGRMPTAGDVVIVTPPGTSEDYIKRVIGVPGDTIEVRGGRLVINGKTVKWEIRPPAMVPVDPNAPCGPLEFGGFLASGPDGKAYCRLPIVRETLPNGVSYDTADLGRSPGDDFGPVRVPAGHVFLMGDNRDRSADSRFALGLSGKRAWRPGAVGEYRRPRRVHHLLATTARRACGTRSAGSARCAATGRECRSARPQDASAN